MKRENFDDAIVEITDTFGGYKKTQSVLDSWYERVQNIPDEAVQFIIDRICAMESLPRNLPLAWQRAWEDWKAKNPKRIVPDDCPHCGNATVRFCWARNEADGWVNFSVPCPACQPPRTGMSLTEMESRGVVIMPPAYRGGPVAFDRDNGFGCLHPIGLDTSTPRPKMHLGRLPDSREQVRSRALTAEERDDYVATGDAANW